MEKHRNEAANEGGEEGLTGVAGPLLDYASRLPGVHSSAVATNLALTRTFLAVKDALTDYLAPHGLGLTRAEYHFLVLLYLAEGKRRPMSEIARELSFSPGYITKLVDQLESAGLVERQAGEVDRRITYAHLTDKGDAKCATIAPAFLSFMEEVGTALSEAEMGQLQSLLVRYESAALRLTNP